MKTTFRQRFFAVAGFLLIIGGLSSVVWVYAERSALNGLAQRGQSDLALAADRLTSELQRFRELAVLTADHPFVAPVLLGEQPAEDLAAVLQKVADKSGSLNVVAVDRFGKQLAAARADGTAEVADSRYFRRAMDGALGVDHFLSTSFDRRAYAFAAPVFADEGPVIGAVIVLADVEEIEASWRGGRPTVFFTDEEGFVFVSNRSELVLLARDGAETAFVPYSEQQRWGHRLWSLDAGRYLPSVALHISLDLPVIGLTGEALIDVEPARQLAALQAAVVAAVFLAFGALLFLATERRRALKEVNARLEARVAQRTQALERLNRDLRHEVTERTFAEAQLKKAQDDLVQAGKLSALGQMSAGISHELNQPLMAIGSFVENAETFLQRGNTDAAARNLTRIGDLSRRMARIIRNLRAFARQESEALSEVHLQNVIQAVLEMVEARARTAGVTIAWEPPAEPIYVRAGEIRLQQVVLNLVGNAIDAMIGQPEPRMEIGVSISEGRVQVSVRDSGPGIAEPEKIFDPFYTTKEVSDSEGMGLGLSISYGLVQSFGGDIRGRNHPDGGAVFTVELDLIERSVAA